MLQDFRPTQFGPISGFREHRCLAHTVTKPTRVECWRRCLDSDGPSRAVQHWIPSPLVILITGLDSLAQKLVNMSFKHSQASYFGWHCCNLIFIMSISCNSPWTAFAPSVLSQFWGPQDKCLPALLKTLHLEHFLYPAAWHAIGAMSGSTRVE